MRRVPVFLCALALVTGCGNGDEPVDSAGAPAAIDPDAITTDARPGKRSEILAAAHEATNSVLIFGGNNGPIVSQIPEAVFVGDTWIFEPGTGWTEVEVDPAPKKRARYTVSVDEDGNRALFFGGRFRPEGQSGDYDLFDDLWQFDFVGRTWTKLDDGSGPAGRYYPASAWDAASGTFYVWGGALNTSSTVIDPGDDLWAWDGASWTELPTSGDAPSTRVFFGAAHDTARNKLLIFGGQKGDFVSQAYNDFYALDLATGAWEQLHDGEGQKVPSTRMHAGLLYDAPNDRYLLWGGHTDIGDQNDLWAFDPEAKTWDKVYMADAFTGADLGCNGNGSEVPADYVTMDLSAPERRHRGMLALLHDNLWLFGGIHAECSDHLDDTWRFDLGEGAYHELIEATSGESCARRNDDCECLCL